MKIDILDKGWATTSLTPCSRISTPYRSTPASTRCSSAITGFSPNDSLSPFTIAWSARPFAFMPFLTADGTRHGFGSDYHRPRTSASNATPDPLRSTGEIERGRWPDKSKRDVSPWKVQELALFGSALRDEFGPDSDVDVLVTHASGTQISPIRRSHQ